MEELNINKKQFENGYAEMGRINTSIAEEIREVITLNEYDDFLETDISDYIAAFKSLNN